MKQRLQKWLSLFLMVTVVIVSVGAITPPTKAASMIKEGDYIQFGAYLNKPIAWRVIDFDENGYPLLFSVKALCNKAIGGPEIYSPDGQKYICTGNWEKSSLRAWMNSEEEAENVVFPYGYPSSINENYFGDGVRAYDKEAGFLSPANFTNTEKTLIVEKTQKSILTKIDIKDAEGGTEVYNKNVYCSLNGRADAGSGYYDSVENMIGNYDTAFYKNIKDKVFLLDIKQLLSVASKYRENFDGYLESELCDYWIRTPDGLAEDLAARAWCWANYHVKTTEPTVTFSNPTYSDAIRPAFYMDIAKADIKSGAGTKESPYLIGIKTTSPSNTINVDINNKNVIFNNNLGYPFVDKANRTQVPLRITMESFGATVDFDKASSTAIVKKDGIEVKVPIGKQYIYKNGAKIETDTAALIKDSRTYLPIRAVIEALGGKVTWDSNSKTVKIIN